ncbi:MAG: PQQ-dependent sugar dehydrogenase, partial [Hyphomicrobium sp.]
MTGNIYLADTALSVNEADGIVYVPITRTGDISGSATVTYGTNESTATSGLDFIENDGTAIFQPGQSTITIPVTIVNDNLSEATETFNFSLELVDASSTLLFPRTARIDIIDDENPPQPDPAVPPLVSNYQVTMQTVISGLNQPIAFEFVKPLSTPLEFVAEKGGRIKVFNSDTGAFISTFIDISGQVNQAGDRGLLDIAVHPDFLQNPYIYAFYVVDPPDAGPPGGPAGQDGQGNRFSYLVRYTADAATGYTTVVPGSAVILLGGAGKSLSDISGGGALDSTDPANINLRASDVDPVTGAYKQDYMKVDSLSHAGGSLVFGPDGALYVGVGDGVSYNYADPRAVSVQDVNSLSGKILRIDPLTGDGLPDNPFVVPGASLDTNAAKVWQLGLRNPYATTFGPDGQLLISETGWFTYEEINKGGAGNNFGWPYYEGGDNGVSEKTPLYSDFASAQAFYSAVANGQIVITPAYRAFAHDDNAPGYQVQAIVGANSIYTGSAYPAVFQNDYFFTDISQGEIYTVDAFDSTAVNYIFTSPTGVGPVHFAQGTDGYMYYADLFAGTIGRFLIAPKPTGGTLPTFSTIGNAVAQSGTFTYTVTPDAASRAGGVVLQDRIDLTKSFDVTFEINVGTKNANGADGMMFVLHNDARGLAALGGLGGAMGGLNIQNGLGIQFDTYRSAGDPNDIANDHTSLIDTDSEAIVGTIKDLGNIEDGAWHQVHVTWTGTTLTYSFDGVQVASVTQNLATQYLGGSQYAYMEFTGATGGLTNLQQVRLLSLDATAQNGTHLTTTPVGTNAPPVAVDDTYTVASGGALAVGPNFGLLANDSDPNSDPIVVSPSSVTIPGVTLLQPSHGTLAVNSNG